MTPAKASQADSGCPLLARLSVLKPRGDIRSALDELLSPRLQSDFNRENKASHPAQCPAGPRKGGGPGQLPWGHGDEEAEGSRGAGSVQHSPGLTGTAPHSWTVLPLQVHRVKGGSGSTIPWVDPERGGSLRPQELWPPHPRALVPGDAQVHNEWEGLGAHL